MRKRVVMADNLTASQRSYCMSRVRGRDTGLEKMMYSELRRRGLRFSRYVKDLPGKPDVVFPRARVAVFIDGDFWHGYRFPTWVDKVSKFWHVKIGKNRARDQRNFRKLRRTGWRVIRLWQHQLEKDSSGCIEKIIHAAHSSRHRYPSASHLRLKPNNSAIRG